MERTRTLTPPEKSPKTEVMSVKRPSGINRGKTRRAGITNLRLRSQKVTGEGDTLRLEFVLFIPFSHADTREIETQVT
ncbi:hypothetical protein J6590_055255 [Homalodisca vitripennis]|nr:hypothetical protein J6590_055255 [Homalodisca vitripennis]